MSHSIRTFLLERVDIEAPTATYNCRLTTSDGVWVVYETVYTRKKTVKVEALMVTCIEGTPDRNADVLSK